MHVMLASIVPQGCWGQLAGSLTVRTASHDGIEFGGCFSVDDDDDNDG